MNRVQRRRRRGESGFTLIELLVVIAILGVLAGIVIFNVTGVSDRGSTAACRTDVSTVQQAVDAYRNNPTNGNPAGSANPASGIPGAAPTMAQLTANGAYLHSTPTACKSYSIAASGNVTAVAQDGTAVP
ncbi:MAG TPA: prepilin-type N-terminal cleavage/methylation domain-containing protein [Candidatus Dormibacteraeota bacterium]